MIILHICAAGDWEAARPTGAYRSASLETEGFIHCSTPAQAADSAMRHFVGQNDLVLLSIDADKVEAEIKYELAANGNTYPHIYGPLNTSAVVDVVPFPRNPDGTFTLPQCFI